MTHQPREIEVRGPSGGVFFVRAVPTGGGLREVGPGNGTVMASVIELVVAAVQTFRASRSGGWTVGVVRRGGPIVGERIVAKEHVASEAELDARIEQLAENVRAGTLT